MGVSEPDARGALRFSLSYSNTEADVDHVIAVFSTVVERASAAGMAGPA
jgi:cysteine desulfurase